MVDEHTKRVNTFNALAPVDTWLAKFNGHEGLISMSGKISLPGGVNVLPDFNPDTHYHGKFRVVVTPDEVQIHFPAERKAVMVEVVF